MIDKPQIIFPESIKVLFLKIIDQAIRDLVLFRKATKNKEKHAFDTAYYFLFDDTYFIAWGDYELSFKDIADLVNVDHLWAREYIRRKLNEKE